MSDGRLFHTLDALRGVAAIGVVVYHVSGAFLPIAVPGGYLAVDLFFIMSGVVLSHAYEARFRAGMGTLDFMRVRLIRLYPLYLLGTLLGIAVTLASLFGRNSMSWDPASLAQAAALALLFLPNLSSDTSAQLFPLNIPCWSLFLELVVNLLFVACWPLLTSRRLLVLCALTGAVLAWAVMQVGNLDQGSTAASLPVGLVRTVFGFSVGVLIARNHASRPRGVSNLHVLGITAAVCVAIVAAPSGLWRAAWDTTCALLLFPLLVYFGTRVEPGPKLRSAATFLGLTSYAVYVLHSPLSSILNSTMRHVSARSGESIGAPIVGFAFLILLLLGCWIVDRAYDGPVRSYLGRIVPKARSVA